MTKKNYQEVNFALGQNRKSKSAKYQKRMPTIRCVCGLRILVVPDLKAIKNHLEEHKRKDYGLKLDSFEAFLTKQVLIVVSKMILPNVS